MSSSTSSGTTTIPSPPVISNNQEALTPNLAQQDSLRDEENQIRQPIKKDDIQVEPIYSAFSLNQRYLIIALASISATFSGFASNIYFPAIPIIAKALNTTEGNINLTVTSYMVFQAISPTFWGAVSDVYGRRLTILCTFVVFLSACIGLALSNHLYQLIILRCLQSTGSASTIAIGSGMIGDIFTRAERGGYMGIFQTGLLTPLAIGPVLGGIFAETLGWRAIFWFLAIYSGIYLVILVLFLPETLRSIVGNGSIAPYHLAKATFENYVSNREETIKDGSVNTKKEIKIDFIAPLKILFHKEVFFVVLYLAIHYATWQMTLTIQSSFFESIYGLTEIQIGLTFLSNGLGCMIGTLTTGKLLDKDYKKAKEKYKDLVNEEEFPIEIVRLRTIWFWSILQLFSVLLFSWTIDKHLHISAPIISNFILAWSAMSIQSIISTFLVDIFAKQAASATASLNLARCCMGAIATGTINPLVNKIGIGWGFMVWVGLMVLSLGLVFIQMKFGMKWRRKREEEERLDRER
ncbi:uncharacterized protein L201_002554 [Kwoniella dendrophila CBS 6074]|uniref:Major facilitator superfamily (MFS) profile domain-containing protein n=1 Tax=Kwoniella dendrophila CBS 6074 TaxID=1295534 RepID=A0AAX4JRZ1_9TREE